MALRTGSVSKVSLAHVHFVVAREFSVSGGRNYEIKWVRTMRGKSPSVFPAIISGSTSSNVTCATSINTRARCKLSRDTCQYRDNRLNGRRIGLANGIGGFSRGRRRGGSFVFHDPPRRFSAMLLPLDRAASSRMAPDLWSSVASGDTRVT